MQNSKKQIPIRTEIRPGDIGEIIRLHGLHYAKEYGWDYTFEGYVAQSFADFVLSADKDKSCLWIVEDQGKIVGSIGIVAKKDSDEAQLRWFFLLPALRGKGFGSKLIKKALDYCRFQNFKSVFLWTVTDLKAAAHVYQSFGFRKVEEQAHPLWGKMITEVKYKLIL